MKAINFFIWVSTIVQGKTGRNSLGIVPLLCLVLLFLKVCPVMGQANNGIVAKLDGDKLFLTIERDILNTEMLFARHGTGQLQVTWSRNDDVLILKQVRPKNAFGEYLPINGDYRIDELILGKFPILERQQNESSLTIEATALFFRSDIQWHRYGGQSAMLMPYSYIDTIAVLPDQTIITVKGTYEQGGKNRTKDVVFSFITLPEPMKPRRYDHRMGYHTDLEMVSSVNAYQKASIERWRLEKKHPKQAISDPKKPIIFYYDPNLPDQWKPYVKKGILEWLPAFEAAGFSNALRVEELPKTYNEHGLYINMIRWKNYENIRDSEANYSGFVDVIMDSRTGEILKGDIILGSSIMFYNDNYLIRSGPADKRVKEYPLPEEITGEMMQVTVAHEAGHAFGLQDGHYGKYGYPSEKLRDATWLREMGYTPSIMNYTRPNYVVQPEDNIPPGLLTQKVGPSDIHHIRWGYTPFDKNIGEAQEQQFLNEMILEKDSMPWYRFVFEKYGEIGPNTTYEVVDSDDPIANTTLGLKNIKRVLEMLPMINKDKGDNAHLERLHSKTMKLWFEEMKHVLSLIGGYVVHPGTGAYPEDVFIPIDKKEQLRAVDYLLNNALAVSEWLVHPSYIHKIHHTSEEDELLVHQINILSSYLESRRLKRLELMQVSPDFENLYSMVMSRLRASLFKELKEEYISIGRRRQELQKTYIWSLKGKLEMEKNFYNVDPIAVRYTPSEYEKSMAMEALTFLRAEIQKVLPKVEDSNSKSHLLLCLKDIEAIVN